jgi:hypothetical protein
VRSAWSSWIKARLKNRMINRTVIHVLSNYLVEKRMWVCKGKFFLKLAEMIKRWWWIRLSITESTRDSFWICGFYKRNLH